MAKVKRSGVAITSASLPQSPPVGPMTTAVLTGTLLDTRRSSRKSERNGFHLHGPFWSDAMRAYRVEYYEHDSTVPGQVWSSSFFCEREEDAVALAALAVKVKDRKAWLAIRDKALVLASASNGMIFRTMLGERHETFPSAQRE